MIRATITASATGNHPGFARTPSPLNTPIIVSGNSLADPMFLGGSFGNTGLTNLITQYNGSNVAQVAKSTTPGSPMSFRWENPTAAPDARLDIDDYSVLIITDIYTSFLTTTFPPTQALLTTDFDQWAQHAWANGRGGLGAETFLWCTWIPQNSTNYQAEWDRNFLLWAQMQDYANARRPNGQKPVRIIPGTGVFYKIWQQRPDFYDDLYTDNIHFYEGKAGPYIINLLVASCVYGIDPTLLPSSIPGLGALSAPDLAYVRGVIRDVVRATPRSGVDTSSWV